MDEKESFLQYIRTEKRYSRNTVSSYKNDLDQFFTWLGVNASDITAGDVTPGEVRAWMVSLIENGCCYRNGSQENVRAPFILQLHEKTWP